MISYPAHSRAGDIRPRRRRMILKNGNGNVTIEFAIVAPILVVMIMNIFDFSQLIWARMEVDYSAQMGAQAAQKTCSAHLPAKTNCAGLTNAVTNAIQATSLGTAVTLASSNPTETYYCVSGTTLQSVGTYSAPPSPFNCSVVGNPSTAPGDYIGVAVTYSYAPIFAGLTLATSQTLTATSVERLN